MIRRDSAQQAAAVLTVWVVGMIITWELGQWKAYSESESLKLGAMPLFGSWEPYLGWQLLLPVTVGALLIVFLPAIAQSWRWRWTALATAAAGVAFSLAMASAHTHPWTWNNTHRYYGEHIGMVDQAGGPGAFLASYIDFQVLGDTPIHLQAHPPGLVLFLWAAAQIGLQGVVFEVVVTMLAGAASILAALAIGREVAGERLTRRAAPFLVVAPYAMWHTNADIIFAGVALAGVACLILATGRKGRRAAALTVAGGLLAGAALMLSFGVALLAVPVLVVAVLRRRWGVLLGGGAIAAAVVLAPLAWGYWWLDGLAATRVRYYAGVASVRGYWYFLLGNLAVYALAIGPAIAVALTRLRHRRMWIVVGSCLAAVALADLSGMSSAETERIWQPFMPLTLLAGCALARPRPWLALQLAVAVALVATLRVQW